jgi:hypothetical protein
MVISQHHFYSLSSNQLHPLAPNTDDRKDRREIAAKIEPLNTNPTTITTTNFLEQCYAGLTPQISP